MIRNTHTADLGVNVEGRGLVALAPGESVDGEPQRSPVFTAWVSAGMIEHDGGGKTAPPEIPDGWRDWSKWRDIVALAQSITGTDEPTTKDEAILVIEAEVERRAE